MRKVPLGRGMYALVDDEDFARVCMHSWCPAKRERTTYACSRIKGKYTLLHRFVLSNPDGEVDHENHDGLDCQRGNLRVTTSTLNKANQRVRGKYKGVFYQERIHRYQAKITSNGNQYHLGYFDCPEQAAKSYDKKAIELFGDFACLNFPEERPSAVTTVQGKS